jgi:hypothetical protein
LIKCSLRYLNSNETDWARFSEFRTCRMFMVDVYMFLMTRNT